MSLPVIKSFADCADFSKTVVPFVPQLYDLHQRIFDSISDPNALKHIYLSTNPLVSASAFCLFTVPIFLIAAEVNRNYSQIDRFWSLLPTFYNLHFTLYAHAKGLPTQRLDILALISILWSVWLFFFVFFCIVLSPLSRIIAYANLVRFDWHIITGVRGAIRLAQRIIVGLFFGNISIPPYSSFST